MSKSKYIFSFICSIACLLSTHAQETVYPALPQKSTIVIQNGNVHTGTGQVLTKTNIVFTNGKIIQVGAGATAANALVVDATGKEVYPGFILSSTYLGLREIGGDAVKGSNDYAELGELNPNVRSIVAYNTDNKILNTLRSNGILLMNVTPQGSLLAGSSSIVQLDAWNWEDAIYAADNTFYFVMPSMLIQRRGRGGDNNDNSGADLANRSLERVEQFRSFLREAKKYSATTNGNENLKLAAVQGLFSKKQKLMIACQTVKEMMLAIDIKKEFDIDVIIKGGSESFKIAALLKEAGIPVILDQLHSLPTSDDDDIDQPFKTPVMLQKAGVLFAINDEDGNSTSRNLAFNAGTAAAYGLSKEEALQSITLNPAKIFGIDANTGSIEVGKDANIIISEGDVLDMKTSKITQAFIQGRQIDLTDKQKLLYQRYQKKYAQDK